MSWDFADGGCCAYYIACGRQFRYRRCGEPDGEFGTGVLECVTCYRRVSLTLGAVFDGTRRSLGLSVHAAGVFSTDREESRRASSSSTSVCTATKPSDLANWESRRLRGDVETGETLFGAPPRACVIGRRA